MKKLSLISSFAVILMFVVGIFTPASSHADPVIEVSPLACDFGDVEVGSSSTFIITISNFDGQPLVVYDIFFQAGSDPGFSFTSQTLPGTIPINDYECVEITFTPSATGLVSAVLVIVSNDTTHPIVSVELSGMGVGQQQPPTSVSLILAFFDDSVADGTLCGSGPGQSADGRRNALRNMIEAAGDLIEDGYTEEACEQLLDAYERTDGLVRPPDFVAGPAAPILADMILDLLASLGCG